MIDIDGPTLPIPEPLRGSDQSSFTERTVRVRMPDIARRTLADNDFLPGIAASIQGLIEEMPLGQIRPLQDPGAPDEQAWAGYLLPYLGCNWLDIPWFFSEHYFYRRILEATGYFQPGPWQRRDPFANQKIAGLLSNHVAIQALVRNLNRSINSGWQRGSFLRLLNADLWGNQADLSMWPAGQSEQPAHAEQLQRQHLLVDDAIIIAETLEALPDKPMRLDFLVDNAGFELVTDLCLVDYLLCVMPAWRVRLHLKAHPTFVSDAMVGDIREAILFLKSRDDAELRAFADRLEERLRSRRLQLKEDYYWTSPLESWRMPRRMKNELRQAALVVSKGDAQYRRLLGDRHWPYNTPLEKILSHFPAPLVILRVAKSEVMAGLQPEQAEQLFREDLEWLYNGRWGLIQLWKPNRQNT